MHRVMGVDIETYSSVDLAEAGVYAYVEAPDFDILLISYIFDDWGEDDVKTIDCFDADPDMMAEFCEALLDPQIVKTRTSSAPVWPSGSRSPCRRRNGAARWSRR